VINAYRPDIEVVLDGDRKRGLIAERVTNKYSTVDV
jgi:hypothetical protein